jgi:X-X-X-Leu-X-X-Gly heptad repeat protein
MRFKVCTHCLEIFPTETQQGRELFVCDTCLENMKEKKNQQKEDNNTEEKPTIRDLLTNINKQNDYTNELQIINDNINQLQSQLNELTNKVNRLLEFIG